MTSAAVAPTVRRRRPYRSPAGLPEPRENWRVGTFVSLLIHVAVVLLVITPFAATDDILRRSEGEGGAGPAGGGGGGNRGSGVVPERIEFVRVAPAAAAPVPPVEKPPPEPVPKPPVELPKPVIQPLPRLQVPALMPKVPLATIGTGGTGADNTAGQGPGSGGGVGSGIGTGRGSGVGPGAGGGDGENYPPTPTELALPPMPIPKSLQGDSVIAEFDVDATGRVLSVKFTDTGDRAYNRKLDEMLRTIRFRPGTTPDGRPIRMKTQVVYQF